MGTDFYIYIFICCIYINYLWVTTYMLTRIFEWLDLCAGKFNGEKKWRNP